MEMGSDAWVHRDHLASGNQSSGAVLVLVFGLGVVQPRAMPLEQHGFRDRMQENLRAVLAALCHMDAAAHSAAWYLRAKMMA